MARQGTIAKRFVVRGRVQGVGFRYFVQKTANDLNVRGWARNLDDGSVEVYATGTPDRLDTLAGYLWKGPRFADVRGVDVQEAAVQQYGSFEIE